MTQQVVHTNAGHPPGVGLWRKVGAEMVGTFALVFAGCAAIVTDEITRGTLAYLWVYPAGVGSGDYKNAGRGD